MTAFGIDLGTTNSVIARMVAGRPEAIAVGGAAVVPSVVMYGEGGTVVGREARNLELLHPERTLRSVKRKMGSDHTWPLPHGPVSPEEASAEILRCLRDGAARATGVEVRDVVITVPAYFDEAQRRATLRAGSLAGLNVLRLINEPTAASMVYERVATVEASTEPELVLVYDLGGGTFDVSVLEVFGEVREVRSTAGDTHLGGDDFDEALVERFLEALATEGADPRADKAAMARLRRVAEETKIALSRDLSVDVREEFLTTHAGKPVHLGLTVTRPEFEALIAASLESTIALTQKALDDAGITADDLARVCLVGGSTRIPKVRDLLREAFEADVHEEIDPDLAVALGAAVQAAVLAGEPVERILVDVCSHSLGVNALSDFDDLEADTFVPIIPRNTVLPATRMRQFYTTIDHQKMVQVEVFQGEAAQASENLLVKEFLFPLEPMPAHSPVNVSFAYTLDGTVEVRIAQQGTHNTMSVSLEVADVSTPMIPFATEVLATEPAAPAAPVRPPSAVEKKAVALRAQLQGQAVARLDALLDAYRRAEGDARESAEEDLLDFFIEHD